MDLGNKLHDVIFVVLQTLMTARDNCATVTGPALMVSICLFVCVMRDTQALNVKRVITFKHLI